MENHFTVFTVDENKKITNQETVASPVGCGCKSNIAGVLANLGVKVMLAGNMGDGAVNVLQNNGISVIRGCSGNVRDVAEAYLAGQITDSGQGCTEHGDGHECHHN